MSTLSEDQNLEPAIVHSEKCDRGQIGSVAPREKSSRTAAVLKAWTRLNSSILWAVASSAIALIAYTALNRNGIEITPDGWAYWQGAISLAEGKGYIYFSGNPIIAWPPAYSLLLAMWTLLFGPYGSTLIIANGALIVIQGFLWFQLCTTLSQVRNHKAHLISPLAVASYIGIFVSLNQRNVFAQNLLYALLPAQIAATWWAIRSSGRDALVACSVVAAVSTLCMLTANSGVAFVGASAVLIMLMGRFSVPWKAAAATMIMSVSLLTWRAVRDYLGQSGSHSIGIDAARQSFFVRAQETFDGLRDLIFPNAVPLVAAAGFLVLVIYIMRTSASAGFEYAFVYACISLLFLVCLFSVTRVVDELKDRFLLFAPLILLPLTIRKAGEMRPAVLALVLCSTFPALVGRTIKWSFVADRPLAIQSGSTHGFGMVPAGAELSHVPATGSARMVNGRLLVAPYPYEEPRLGSK